VIHLDTAPQHFYDLTNALRIESYEEAVALNNKIKESWSRHPQRFVIDNTGHFVDKLYRATLVIEQILAGRTYQEIQSQISSLQI
jgi:hypothetical protein